MRVWQTMGAVLILSVMPLGVSAQTSRWEKVVDGMVTQEKVVDRIVTQEKAEMQMLRQYAPLVETYIQMMRPDPKLGSVPAGDKYFLGIARLANGVDLEAFAGDQSSVRRILGGLGNFLGFEFEPRGFLQMIYVDTNGFDQHNYRFDYVRQEFLGDVRCLVFDVTPNVNAGMGRFMGRIWVEDQDYHIVRFNGAYNGASRTDFYFHFDSWRVLAGQQQWLPAYIYSEEGEVKYAMTRKLTFKSQTRLWGYNVGHTKQEQELSKILVQAAVPVKDQAEGANDYSPLQAQRAWDLQAEDNIVDRMARLRLLAPSGEVDKVLETVVNNLEVTNNLNLEPEVRCRVLTTSTLESFTIGHTIVVSKGLLDVLPDEASLAMILARELGHIALGHQLDTKFAFNDRMFFADEDTFSNLSFRRSSADEAEADKRALELLANSPYKDKLGNAGLFLKALQARAPELKNLIRARLGEGLVSGKTLRMSALLNSAPQLDERKKDQIAALPLGGRVKVDPWSNDTTLAKTKPVALLSAREKMPFEVTPVFPYLSKIPTSGAERVASTSTSAAPAAK